MLDFLTLIFPTISEIIILTPITILLIFLFLFLAGKIKIKYNIKTNYTRKLFHILVFTMAGVIGLIIGHKGVMFYGGLTGLIMIYVIYQGKGYILYEAVAREQDEPHRSFYIGVPFLSTALGGLFNTYLFGSLAIVGYLVAGWGDAIGEPIGVRFGKHKYKVPTLRKVACQRSLEGSLAVLIVSMLAIFIVLWLISDYSWWLIIISSVLAGIITAIVEAVSPHGLDNFTTQIAAAAVCFGILMAS